MNKLQQGKDKSQERAEDRAAKADEKGSAVPTKADGERNSEASEPGTTDNKTAGEGAKEVCYA